MAICVQTHLGRLLSHKTCQMYINIISYIYPRLPCFFGIARACRGFSESHVPAVVFRNRMCLPCFFGIARACRDFRAGLAPCFFGIARACRGFSESHAPAVFFRNRTCLPWFFGIARACRCFSESHVPAVVFRCSGVKVYNCRART